MTADAKKIQWTRYTHRRGTQAEYTPESAAAELESTQMPDPEEDAITTQICGQPHPHLVYETGAKVRCGSEAGHEGQHFDSFAMRSWDDQPSQEDAMTTPTTWIKYEGQTRWHVTGLWDKETRCGKPVTGDEESQTYIRHSAPTCGVCRAAADKAMAEGASIAPAWRDGFTKMPEPERSGASLASDHAAGMHKESAALPCPACQREQTLSYTAQAAGEALMADAQAQALYELRERLDDAIRQAVESRSRATRDGLPTITIGGRIKGLKQAMTELDVLMAALPIHRRAAGEMTIRPTESDGIVTWDAQTGERVR